MYLFWTVGIITSERNLIPISSHSLLPPHPQHPKHISLLSLSMDFPILVISYKWNYMWSFVAGFFHLMFWRLFMLEHVLVLNFY